MSSVLIASNAYSRANKWLPYSYKPFMLGTRNGIGSTDGGVYVTQTTGTSGVALNAACIDEHNCGYYYVLTIVTGGGSDNFKVEKYNKDTDTLVDTIFASATSGNGRYWAGTLNVVTIDIGVVVDMISSTTYDTGDVFKITLPTVEQMRARRFYHGGFSTYLRLPEEEGKTYSSDIIPTSLLNRNITFIGGMQNPFGEDEHPLRSANSYADTGGNKAVSASIVWNLNPEGVHSTTASSTGYNWIDGETWQFGSLFADDLDTNNADDMPIIGNFPASDVSPVIRTTGDPQASNISVAGRAGHAKIRLEYMTGTGTAVMLAHNQWWPVTLILG